MPEERRNKIYVVTPSPILEWIMHYLKESVIHLDLIVIIPTHHLNPEEFYYHQKFTYYQVEPETDREHADFCEPLDIKEVTEKIEKFAPRSNEIAEMWTILREEMDFEKVIAVEVDHCPQSYACLLVSKQHGNIIFSGDTLPC